VKRPLRTNTRIRVCSSVQSAGRRGGTLCVCDLRVPPVTTDEHAARRIRELEDTVRVLEETNVQLKVAVYEFGALAERLIARLRMVEPRTRILACEDSARFHRPHGDLTVTNTI
jgi:hypothetical protein